MVTAAMMTMIMWNKDEWDAISWHSPLRYKGGSDDSVDNSDTADDLIAGKNARLKKSLSSCSTWLEIKLKTKMTQSTQRICQSAPTSIGHDDRYFVTIDHASQQ